MQVQPEPARVHEVSAMERNTEGNSETLLQFQHAETIETVRVTSTLLSIQSCLADSENVAVS